MIFSLFAIAILSNGRGVPANAILWMGQPVLWNGEFLTWNPA